MIIEHEQKNEVIQGGNVPMEEKAMRIKASAKAFKVLSDSLYSDKIFAIIREVGCNAQDAHVDAGKPNEPFHVVLPNSFSPNFIVRDFGTGISDEHMDSIYTVFFESTKTDASKQSSYDSTGMLGLGCKSPLAYTDSFVVESFIDGVKNAYSIYKNEHGIPSCVRMSSEPTDEQNGLKVTIPVGSNDFSNFANKAKGVFKHFKNRPKITGNDITVPEKDYYLENQYFGLRTKDWDNGKAIMGNISYPLNDLSDDSLTDVERSVLKLDIDLFFDLGKLDFAASREKLSYDKVTISNIQAKIAEVISSMEKTISDSIDTCETLWDARVKYKKIITEQSLQNIAKDLKVTYKGTDISEWQVALTDLRADGVTKDKDGNFEKPFNFYVTHCERTNKRVKTNNVNSIPVANNVHVIVDDIEGKKLSNRVRTFMDKHTERLALYVIEFNDVSYIEKVRKHLGMTSFMKLSEMEFTTATRSYSGSTTEYNPMYAKKAFEYTPENYSHGACSNFWTATEIDESEDVIYVNIDRFKIDGDKPDEYFDNYFTALKEIGEDPESLKIYGVKSGQEIGEDWIPFKEYVEQLVKESVENNTDFHMFCLKSEMEHSDDLYLSGDWKELCKAIADKVNDPNIKHLNNFFSMQVKNFHQSRFYFGREESNKLAIDHKKKLVEATKQVDVDYPMLSCVELPNSYYSKNERSKVVIRVCDYVNSTYARV